ncbi:hypothetical protein ACWEQ2_31255 [Streptomyces sp. NPDC004096]
MAAAAVTAKPPRDPRASIAQPETAAAAAEPAALAEPSQENAWGQDRRMDGRLGELGQERQKGRDRGAGQHRDPSEPER